MTPEYPCACEDGNLIMDPCLDPNILIPNLQAPVGGCRKLDRQDNPRVTGILEKYSNLTNSFSPTPDLSHLAPS